MTGLPAAATREAYPSALIQLVEQGVDVVAIDADLSASTGGHDFGEHIAQWAAGRVRHGDLEL